jgi:hypothetical protein
VRVAYLTSRYPAVSHTFIAREVRGLRELGVDVCTYAVRGAAAGDALSPGDRAELARTVALLPTTPGRLAGAHARALARAPLAYLRTLAGSVRLSTGGLRATLWRLFYFAEAMLLWDSCRAGRIGHVHVHFPNVAADVAMLAAGFGAAAGRGPRTWSLSVHGPTEFFDVRGHRLAEKVADARFVVCISDFARSQVMGVVEPAQWPKLHVVRLGVDLAQLDPGGAA